MVALFPCNVNTLSGYSQRFRDKMCCFVKADKKRGGIKEGTVKVDAVLQERKKMLAICKGCSYNDANIKARTFA